jgi:hypothetical protein
LGHSGQFKKGHKRLGGRKPGTPNKRTSLLEKAEERGVDPWSALLELCTHNDAGIRLSAVKEACSYLYAKMKYVEIPPGDEESSDGQAVLAQIKKVINDPRNERKA